MKAIVLAGGGGSRLWPISTQNKPKQLHKLIDEDSLLSGTIKRLRPVFADEDIIITTGEGHGKAVLNEYADTDIRVIVEPERKDTLGAIGVAVALIARENIDESFIVINSDAHVLDIVEYQNVLVKVGDIVKNVNDTLVLVGLKPDFPETAYGYIECGEPVSVGDNLVHKVKQFKEKPDLETAKGYVSAGKYLWNPSMVGGTAKKFLNSVCRHEPEIYKELLRLIDAENFDICLTEVFKKMPRQTVDYGILERENDMLVLTAEFGWTDIGNWKTVHDRSRHDENGNVIIGNIVTRNVKGSLIRNDTDRKIAVIGLENIVVIETADSTLIINKDNAQDVKNIVGKLKDI